MEAETEVKIPLRLQIHCHSRFVPEISAFLESPSNCIQPQIRSSVYLPQMQISLDLALKCTGYSSLLLGSLGDFG